MVFYHESIKMCHTHYSQPMQRHCGYNKENTVHVCIAYEETTALCFQSFTLNVLNNILDCCQKRLAECTKVLRQSSNC